MSSVPIQFLIYVMPEFICSKPPLIIPLSGCLELTANVPRTFNLTVLNQCNPNITRITNITVTNETLGFQIGNLVPSPTDASLNYVTLSWTPQTTQVGFQKLCLIAHTEYKSILYFSTS